MSVEESLSTGLRAAASAGDLTLRIAGECMRPALVPGDFVSVRPARLLFPGDLVAFVGNDRRLTVHRVLGYRPGRPWTLLTQADGAPEPDSPVPLDRVLGRVVAGRRAVSLRHRLRACRAHAARAVAAGLRRWHR